MRSLHMEIIAPVLQEWLNNRYVAQSRSTCAFQQDKARRQKKDMMERKIMARGQMKFEIERFQY